MVFSKLSHVLEECHINAPAGFQITCFQPLMTENWQDGKKTQNTLTLIFLVLKYTGLINMITVT